MRINGFSGMDIDSMVSSLMTVQKSPLNKLNQQKQVLQWTRDSYREVNSKIIDFRAKLFDMNKSAAMNTQQATVIGNTTAIRADATSSALASGMEVTVTKLATKSNIQTATGLMATKADGTQVAATSKTTLAELAGGTASDTYDLNINDRTITFLKTDSLATVAARINSEGAGVNASFDEISGKFSITAKDYGTTNNIKLTGSDKQTASSSLFSLMNVDTATQLKNAEAGEVTVKSTTDGSSRTFNPTDATLSVNGVNLTLLSTTGATGPATITTQPNTDKAVETIKSFVESYNSLLDMLNTKTTEQKYRSFTPLTDEQKKEMKENEITQWEEKAKSGLLKNDNILTSAVSNMRSVISGSLKNLSEIGITTGQYFENGKLKIDEAKLKSALTTDPQKVMDIFQGSSSAGKTGVYSGIRDTLNSTLDQFVSKAGTSKFDSNANSTFKEISSMGNQLKDYNKRITALQSRLNDMETRYYKQFSAMEEAMSKYQAQSSSLAGFLQ